MNPTIAAPELEQRVKTLGDEARAFEVVDQVTYDFAVERLKGVVALRNEIVEHHAEMKRRTHQAWQAVLAAEKKLLDPVADAERVYKRHIGDYETEQRRIEAERLALAEAEAQRIAAEQREREIEQAEAAGADPEEVAAICAEPLPVVAPAPPRPTFQRAAGVSTASNWKGQCFSPALLVKAIADGKANINLVSANETAINALARATRGTLQVPGIRFFNEPTVRTRR